MISKASMVVLAVSLALALSPRQSAAVDLKDAAKASNDLLLTLREDQTSYKVGAHVVVTVSIRNLGPDIVIRQSFVPTDYAFVFLNEAYSPIPFEALQKSGASAAPTGTSLASGQTLTKTINLDEYYKLNAPGYYRVVATSDIRLSANPSSVYTTLISNPIAFGLY